MYSGLKVTGVKPKPPKIPHPPPPKKKNWKKLTLQCKEKLAALHLLAIFPLFDVIVQF